MRCKNADCNLYRLIGLLFKLKRINFLKSTDQTIYSNQPAFLDLRHDGCSNYRSLALGAGKEEGIARPEPVDRMGRR